MISSRTAPATISSARWLRAVQFDGLPSCEPAPALRFCHGAGDRRANLRHRLRHGGQRAALARRPRPRRAGRRRPRPGRRRSRSSAGGDDRGGRRWVRRRVEAGRQRPPGRRRPESGRSRRASTRAGGPGAGARSPRRAPIALEAAGPGEPLGRRRRCRRAARAAAIRRRADRQIRRPGVRRAHEREHPRPGHAAAASTSGSSASAPSSGLTVGGVESRGRRPGQGGLDPREQALSIGRRGDRNIPALAVGDHQQPGVAGGGGDLLERPPAGAPRRSKQASCSFAATQAGPARSISSRAAATTAADAASAGESPPAAPAASSVSGSGSIPTQTWLCRSSTRAASRSANGALRPA